MSGRLSPDRKDWGSLWFIWRQLGQQLLHRRPQVPGPSALLRRSELCLIQLGTHMPVVDPGQANVPPNDSAVVTVETRNGAHGTLYLSRVAATSAMGQFLTVHGESGVLSLESRLTKTGAQIVLMRPDKPPKELLLPDVPAREIHGDGPYLRQVIRFFSKQPAGDRALIDAIRGDPSVQPSFYDGYKAQQAIDAAFESHETGRRIAIPDD